MPSFEYDLTFLQGGIPELQVYLLSNEIYWPLGLPAPAGEPPYPRLTMGWLLLALRRAQGWVNATPTSPKSYAIQSLAAQLDQMRSRWRTAWEKKATQEFSSRLKLWADYLNEFRSDKPAHARRYTYEVQRRVILDLLQAETMNISQTEIDLLIGMDNYVRSVLKPEGFVWEKEISMTFPPERYWYLYGKL